MPEHLCSKCGHIDYDGVRDPGAESNSVHSDNASSDIKEPDLEAEVEVERTKFSRRIVRDRKEFDNTYHPGIETADLVHNVHHVRVSDRKPYQYHSYDGEKVLLCDNCGLTTDHRRWCAYTSRVKLFYTRSNSAIWDLGPNGPWMLRDEPNDANNGWKRDYIVQKFLLKEKPNLPLIEMHKFGGPSDKFHFTIMSRARGSTIQQIWHTLTLEQQTDVVQDLGKFLKECRQITRPHIQGVDGSKIRDIAVGSCNGRGCIEIGHDEEEWLQNLTPAMRKGLLKEIWIRHRGQTVTHATLDSWVNEVDEKIVQLMANFPRGGPYVITHGDLHAENIFISDDNKEKKFKVSAVVDWEISGFFPWWVERLRNGLTCFSAILNENWDILHPGYSQDDWDSIMKCLVPVKDVWRRGGGHSKSKHMPDRANDWFSAPFCACKPYGRRIRGDDLGLEDVHLDILDVDSSDSEDEDQKEFSKFDRQFLRWFNQINNRPKNAESISPSPIKIRKFF